MNGAWPHHGGDLGLRYADADPHTPLQPPAAYRDAARTALTRVGQARPQPQPQPQPPTPATAPAPKSYPWYFWVGATVVTAGAGYLLWRYLRGPSRRRDPEALSSGPPRPVEGPSFEPMTLKTYVERGPAAIPGGDLSPTAAATASQEPRYVLTRFR